jgi:hypothetical protein
MLSMLYDRSVLADSHDRIDRQLGADQSPQAGCQFMMIRQEVFTTKLIDAEVGDSTKISYWNGRLPPAVMGLGMGQLPDLISRMVMSILLIAGDQVDKFRYQVRSWLTDQSTERKMTRGRASILYHCCPCRKLSDAEADDECLLFPDCIEILDHLHIFWNAVENAIEALDFWKTFREMLSAVIALFGDSMHLKRFISKCDMPMWVGYLFASGF